MGNITISVDQIICEAPVFTNVTYTGVRFEYLLSWTSMGDYYFSFDNTATMSLVIQLYAPGQTTPYFTGLVNPPIAFNAVDFSVNILDYDANYSPKDTIVFTLMLTGENSCDVQTTYTIPGEP